MSCMQKNDVQSNEYTLNINLYAWHERFGSIYRCNDGIIFTLCLDYLFFSLFTRIEENLLPY